VQNLKLYPKVHKTILTSASSSKSNNLSTQLYPEEQQQPVCPVSIVRANLPCKMQLQVAIVIIQGISRSCAQN